MFLVLSFIFAFIIGWLLHIVIENLPIRIAKNNHAAAVEILNLKNIELTSSYRNSRKQNLSVNFLSCFTITLLAWQFGPTLLFLVASLLVFALIILAFIDINTLMLPDEITIPLIWLGLFVNSFKAFSSLIHAVYGAIFGYLMPFLFAKIFYKLRNIKGLGEGDLKLISGLGAWFGWQLLPLIILIASITGIVYGLLSSIRKKRKLQQYFPFGPFLSLAGFVVLVLNPKTINCGLYLQFK